MGYSIGESCTSFDKLSPSLRCNRGDDEACTVALAVRGPSIWYSVHVMEEHNEQVSAISRHTI